MVVNILDNITYVLKKLDRTYLRISIVKKYIKYFKQQNQDIIRKDIGEDIDFFTNEEEEMDHEKNNVKEVL